MNTYQEAEDALLLVSHMQRTILDDGVRRCFTALDNTGDRQMDLPTDQLHYHDGVADFPHGAGASAPGWYVYESEDLSDEPSGPFPTLEAAYAWAVEHLGY